jgi:hypothetical protein
VGKHFLLPRVSSRLSEEQEKDDKSTQNTGKTITGRLAPNYLLVCMLPMVHHNA